jgi:hypothetical protein
LVEIILVSEEVEKKLDIKEEVEKRGNNYFSRLTSEL